jgi:flagellar basal-body rod protein FlgC
MGIFRVVTPRGLFRTFDISATGLSAERLRMDVIANNIANVNTTRTELGTPFRRKRVIFEERFPPTHFHLPFIEQPLTNRVGAGVRVVRIEEDMSPFRLEYRPDHPDADEKGYVRMPNVNIVVEMTDMITATRAYEANVACIRAARRMMMEALRIGGR